MIDQTWTVVTAIAAAASAVVAAVQVALSKREANRRQTIELLQALESRLDAVMGLDLEAVRDSVLASYRARQAATEDGRRYLSFVHAIELLADARQFGGVDRKMTDRFLRSLVRNDIIPLSFVDGLQRVLEDDEAYSQTRALLSQYRPKPLS